MQDLDVWMRSSVVFPGQVLGSCRRAVRVGRGAVGSSSGVRKTRPSGDPWAGGRRLGKGIERGVRACAGVMPGEREEGMEQRDSGGQGGGMGSGD